jgi:hypothetical protein
MIQRRDFIKIACTGIAGWCLDPAQALAELVKVSYAPNRRRPYDGHVKDYLQKMQNFNKHYRGDVFVASDQLHLLRSSVRRLKRLHNIVGYGNFHLLSFDDSLKYARNYSKIGRFSQKEIDFLEMIFYEDAARYGFFGQKPLAKMTGHIDRTLVKKVPNTGHYLYKGIPHETFIRIRQQLGEPVILTSGVRSVMKQFLLFLNKADKNRGNLSLASRQLAPPGYSFHGISDFDVGQVGYGAANFTERFMYTDVYRRLESLGYLMLRYPQDNLLGVRFEPWHIKVHA